MLNVERKINNFENTLSDVAFYPVVGTLAGGVKVVLGAGQFVTALFWGVLALVPTLCGKRGLMEHSWTHIKHGLGNIVAGVFEAIPLVGTILKMVRDRNAAAPVHAQLYVTTQHERKFMAYESLEKQDLTIARGAGFDKIGEQKDSQLEDVKFFFEDALDDECELGDAEKGRKAESVIDVRARLPMEELRKMAQKEIKDAVSERPCCINAL